MNKGLKLTKYIIQIFIMTIIFTIITPNAINAEGTKEYWKDHAASNFSGGAGTEKDPYQISCAEELAYLAEIVNKRQKVCDTVYYELTNDIDLKTYDWIPIGTVTVSKPFAGHFDGKGHKIENVHIRTESDYENVWVFGYTDKNATIENIGVSVMDGNVGGLVGNNNGVINNSYATGAVTGEYLGIGKLVVGVNEVGGLVGSNNGIINNSYATGDVTGKYGNVGGLVGYNNNDGTISNGYYNKEAAEKGIGKDENTQTTARKTSEQMQSQEFADELNNNRKGKDDWKQWGIDLVVNGGYPTFLVEELPVNDVAKPNTGLDKKSEQ